MQVNQYVRSVGEFARKQRQQSGGIGTLWKSLTKALACVLVVSLTGISLSACVSTQTQEPTTAPAIEAPKTRTVVDQVGNVVELPEKIERVVISSAWPLASVYCLYMGSADKLVGVDPAIISAAKDSTLARIAPEIVDIPSDFIKGGVMNAEELAALKPDVVLYSTGTPEDFEIAQKAGVPAVAFSLSIADYNAIETIYTWIDLLAEVMQENFDREKLVAYGDEIQEMVASRLTALKDDQKPRSMFVHLHDEATLGVPGSNSWADYWLTASGGINIAADAGTGTLNPSMEEIYQWNPEIIFVTNFNTSQPEDFYSNSIGNRDWSNINAVQNQKVIKMPLGIYRWYVCNSDSPLVLLWMAKQQQPELFTDIDMDQTIKDYYKEFYNLELTEADVQSIYHPSSASGVL
jgi:iron complex transport system substrate-binding protein